MANLIGISVTIHTQHYSASQTTPSVPVGFHLFVKNRLNTTAGSNTDTTYVANDITYKAHDEVNWDRNPYLGRKTSVGLPEQLTSSVTFDCDMRIQMIPYEEVVLPYIDVHFVPGLLAQKWIFDYAVSFVFDDANLNFSFQSASNGISGVYLDQDNRDYSGICYESNKAVLVPIAVQPMNAVLSSIHLTFHTHGDNKDADTVLNVRIVDRVSASLSRPLAVAKNVLPNTEFAVSDTTEVAIIFAANDPVVLPLAAGPILLQELMLPVVNIGIEPNGSDTWKFDYNVNYVFDFEGHPAALQYSSTTSGVVLSEACKFHSGVYQGNSFPITKPVVAALSGQSVGQITKYIPLSFLNLKLNEVITSRRSTDPQSPTPAVLWFHIDHEDAPDGGLPSTFYDVQTITAGEPAPGTPLPAGYEEPVDWTHAVNDLGPLSSVVSTFHLSDINSNAIIATVDATQAAPLSVKVQFETDGPNELSGGILTSKFKEFSIELKMTLNVDPVRNIVDLMSWVADLTDQKNLIFTPGPLGNPVGTVTGSFLGSKVGVPAVTLQAGITTLLEQVLLVKLTTTDATDPGGFMREKIRDTIFDQLKNPRAFGQSIRESLNSTFNSLLLGGTVDGVPGAHTGVDTNCTVQYAKIEGDNLKLVYTGPVATYQFDQPADWPAGHDFSQGTLAQIDHIIVLTMENRSFDHMLGYLSLPLGSGGGSGGMGRTNIDGLKGGEVNYINLVNGHPIDPPMTCPSVALLPGETAFGPDPPHSFEPVQQAISGSKNSNDPMGGFAQAFADERGTISGPNIMKYHTGVNVPVYDALARDFAVGQRWFASHPGPTFCNRYAELSGRLNIDPEGFFELSNGGLRPVFTKTIFDHLDDAQISWKYFEHIYCFLRFFQEHTFKPDNIFEFTDSGVGFVNTVGTRGALPSVTFIDPHFIELPPGGNCDGPPADVARGQELVRKVVNAVVTSPAWSTTLLIITYDEHGGFYDHVVPPAAVPMAPGLPGTFGVRVPAFVISPWVTGGSVFGYGTTTDATGESLYFDHTSILKTIARRFLDPQSPPYMGPRYAAANDLSSVLETTMREGPFLPFIPYSLTYASSKKYLDVQGGLLAPGTPLQQFDSNGTYAQLFNFEDAGGGYFYIRTDTGGLYLTVDVGSVTGATQYGTKLDVKYPLSGGQNPDYQRWALHQPQASKIGQLAGTIRNAAFPGMALHPLGESVDSGTSVVLETETVSSPTSVPYPWIVTSLLLSNGPIFAPPAHGVSVVASPAAIIFPSQYLLTQSTELTTTVTAQGALSISAITLTDGPGGASKNYTCSPVGSPPFGGNIVIPDGGQLTVYAWFHPTAVGTLEGQIELTHDAPGSPLVIKLSGVGDGTLVPMLSFSPNSISFSKGKPTKSLVTLTNTGKAPLTITGMSLASPSFTFANTCGFVAGGSATLQPGQHCTVNVGCRFNAPEGSATLLITHDGPDSPSEINLDFINDAS